MPVRRMRLTPGRCGQNFPRSLARDASASCLAAVQPPPLPYAILLRSRASRYIRRGLTKKYGRYSAEFKMSVLRRMWAEKLSPYDASAIFNIRSPNYIARWEHVHREGGIEALKPATRGRPTGMKKPKDKVPPRQQDAKRSQEELIAELNQLRMENAYLKKLDTLVRARQAPRGRK